MKELSIEEKAKRYDEAIEKLRNAFFDNNSRMCEEYRKAVIRNIEPIFPELAESEDERIRKFLTKCVKENMFVKSFMADGFDKDEVLAWLEKQCTPAKLSEEEQNRFAKGVLTSCAISFVDYLDAHKYKGKMCVSNGECEDIENAFHNAMWDRLHRYYCKYIEKQGEQKPIESMPEFKEGDILYNKDSYASDSIFIFKGMSDKTNAYLCYARLYNKKDFTVYSKEDWDEGVGVYGGEFYPATKEQRDLLFQKMKEAGYEWNAEKKELNKIVTPIFNIGDTIIKKHNSDINDFGSFTITDITGCKYWYNDRIICDITEQNEWELYETDR